MKNFKLTYLMATTAAVLAFPLSSHAVTLSDPYFQGEVSLEANGNDFDTTFSSPTIIDESRASTDPDPDAYPSYASTRYSLSAAPLPGLSASSTMDLASAGSTGFIGYQFSIVGPAGSVPVTINFSGADTITGFFALASTQVTVQAGVATVLGTGPSFSDSYSIGYSDFAQYGSHTLNGVVTPLAGTSFNATDSVTLAANAVYSVALQLSVLMSGSGSGSAYVDPLIQIDPAFADASQYSIELSPGIGNSPAPVPLPATGLLLLAGLAAFGTVSRQRLCV